MTNGNTRFMLEYCAVYKTKMLLRHGGVGMSMDHVDAENRHAFVRKCIFGIHAPYLEETIIDW